MVIDKSRELVDKLGNLRRNSKLSSDVLISRYSPPSSSKKIASSSTVNRIMRLLRTERLVLLAKPLSNRNLRKRRIKTVGVIAVDALIGHDHTRCIFAVATEAA